MLDSTADRFADSPVADQVAPGFSTNRIAARRRFNIEGRTVGLGRRVTRRASASAKSVIKSSRAKTKAGKRAALIKAGLATKSGKLIRRAPARKLSGSELNARVVGRRERKTAGTKVGRARNRRRANRERRAALGRAVRRR